MSQGPPERPASASTITGEDQAEAWRVRLSAFEGPLDLLLHLVRVNDIDILDIPMVEITQQYQAYVELMRELRLDVAGEYLLMAATLMHIKSRTLLPPDPQEEEAEGEDPRADLTRQLLEYQRFKQAAENLQALDSRRALIWTRERIAEEFEGEELLTADLFDVLSAFRKLLGRLGEEARLRMQRDNVSVAEKIEWLTEVLQRRRSVDLISLLEDLPSRLERIAAFLALLEMMRLQLVIAMQRKARGEIRIALVTEAKRRAEGPQAEAESLSAAGGDAPTRAVTTGHGEVEP